MGDAIGNTQWAVQYTRPEIRGVFIMPNNFLHPVATIMIFFGVLFTVSWIMLDEIKMGFNCKDITADDLRNACFQKQQERFLIPLFMIGGIGMIVAGGYWNYWHMWCTPSKEL